MRRGLKNLNAALLTRLHAHEKHVAYTCFEFAHLGCTSAWATCFSCAYNRVSIPINFMFFNWVLRGYLSCLAGLAPLSLLLLLQGKNRVCHLVGVEWSMRCHPSLLWSPGVPVHRRVLAIQEGRMHLYSSLVYKNFFETERSRKGQWQSRFSTR